MKKKFGILLVCMTLVITFTVVIPIENVKATGPIANFTFTPPNPVKTDIIQFTDTSTDPDGTIVSRWWNFGDGYYSDLQNPIHCYYVEGVYSVTLTVEDDNGMADHITKQINLMNNPPTATIDSISPNPSGEGELVSFSGHGTDTDGTIVAYDWESSIDGHLSSSATFSSSTLSTGTHTILFKVKDDNDAWSSVVTESLEIISSTMHVKSIEMSTETKTYFWGEWTRTRALATITIVDGNNNPVEGAIVSGDWSGLTSGGNNAGITDSHGEVTPLYLYSYWVWDAQGTFTFTVDNVIKSGWTYDESANLETSDSITV